MEGRRGNRSLALTTRDNSPGCLAVFGSLWEFEELGINEIKERIEQAPTRGPAVQVNYDENSHTFLLRRNNDLKMHAAMSTIMEKYICENKDGHLLDLPRIRPLTDDFDEFVKMKPFQGPEPNSGDLLDFAMEETQIFDGPTTKSWYPGKMSDYFLADKLRLLPQIAEATHTDISTMISHVEPNPVRINVTGATKEDVDEALDKLEATLDFTALVQQPVQDIVVLGTPGDAPQYRVVKLTDTKRAISNLVAGNHNLQHDSASFMIPHAQLLDANADSQAPRTFATTHETHQAPAKWKDYDFPALGSPQKKSTKANSSAWPAVSNSNSEMHVKDPAVAPVSSRSNVSGSGSGSGLVTSPKSEAPTLNPTVPMVDSNTKAVQDAAVRMFQADLERLTAAKGIPFHKVRKPVTLVDEKAAPRPASPTTPVLRAATVTPKKNASTSISGATSSTLPSIESGIRSPSPASESSLFTTPCSSPPPATPPLRHAVYASRSGSPAKVQRPEFDPGTRDRPASIRFPGCGSSHSPRPSSPAVSGLHEFGQTTHDRFMLSSNAAGPSRQPFTPVPKGGPHLLDLFDQTDPFCLPKPRVAIQTNAIAPNPIIPDLSSPKRPPVPPKPPYLFNYQPARSRIVNPPVLAAEVSAVPEGASNPGTPSTLPMNITQSNTLIDLDPMDDDPGPTNLTLLQEGFVIEGAQDQAVVEDAQEDVIGDLQEEAVVEGLQEKTTIEPTTEPVKSNDDSSCRRVSNPINYECPLEIYVTEDKLVMVPCMDILRGEPTEPQGIGLEETVDPEPQQMIEETAGAGQQGMVGEPASSEPQEGTLNTTHPSGFSVQTLLLGYLRDQVRIFSSSPSPTGPTETQDQADEPVHETLRQVSEDTPAVHNTMNQMSARPPDLKEGSKAKADSKARHKAKKNDIWGFTDIQSIHGHGKVAQVLLAPALERAHGESSASSSKHRKTKSSKSKDRSKTVYHIIDPVLSTAQSFPGRLNLEIQLGIVFIPPTAPVGPMSLSGLREYFHPQTGLPPPKSIFNNRLSLSEGDLDKLINLQVDERRMFDITPFEDSLNFEFHCSFPCRGTVESFIVTILENEPSRITKNGLILADIHLNFPEHVWDASLMVTGQSAYVDLPSETRDAIQDMIKAFNRSYPRSDSDDIEVETTIPPSPFEVKQILLKRVTKHSYLRARENHEKEDLYLKVTKIRDQIISFSGPENTKVTASCAAGHEKSTRPRRWSEASLVSSSTEDSLESNWKLELGSSTTKWTTPELFGHGNAPASPSVSDCPDHLIDAPGLWSLFGLTEMVVKNMDGVGYRPPTDIADANKENTKPTNALVVSNTPVSGSTSGPGTRDSTKSLVRSRHFSRLNEWPGDSPSRRFW